MLETGRRRTVYSASRVVVSLHSSLGCGAKFTADVSVVRGGAKLIATQC